MSTTGRQLSLHVAPHPATVWADGEHKPIVGALKISGALTVDEDLQPGEDLTIQVCNADGQVIASSSAQIGPIGFKSIKQSGVTIGTERMHTAEVIW